MSQQREENGVLSWVLIGLACFSVIGAMVWIVGSHAIVFYTSSLFYILGQVWKLFPEPLAGTAVADVEVTYRLFRQKANFIEFGEWLEFGNMVMKPYVYIFIALAVWLFVRQLKIVKRKKLNKPLGPKELAYEMTEVFSEISPVVAIQDQLVGDKLPNWRRQVFPEELIKQIRYQGKSVLLPDPHAKRQEGDRGLMLDEGRLSLALSNCKSTKHQGVTLLRNPYLGRQIVNLIQDNKIAKEKGSAPNPFDRMSDTGKALFAILVPYAFGAKKGRAQSREVIDALNFSAFGSPDGQANLSLGLVQESFSQWREDPSALRLAKVHHWENTYLYALLERARLRGKIGTWSFIWLKPMNRILFYVLNTCGRKTPHSEAALAFSQHQFEIKTMRKGRLPLTPDGKPQIYVEQVVRALSEEWDFWRKADDNGDDDIFDFSPDAIGTTAMLADLNSISVAPVVPRHVL